MRFRYSCIGQGTYARAAAVKAKLITPHLKGLRSLFLTRSSTSPDPLKPSEKPPGTPRVRHLEPGGSYHLRCNHSVVSPSDDLLNLVADLLVKSCPLAQRSGRDIAEASKSCVVERKRFVVILDVLRGAKFVTAVDPVLYLLVSPTAHFTERQNQN